MARPFFERTTLKKRGAVEPAPDEYVDGLLVDDAPTGRWEEGETQYGSDAVRVYPAYHCGKKCFLVERVWSPAMGYCASGTEEEIVSFDEGVKMLLVHGAYENMWAKALDGQWKEVA